MGVKMRIGYIAADFPVLSETFVVNDMRGLEALGHDVTAIALGGADPATIGNPNYQIKGPTIRVKGLRPPIWRKVQKWAGRRRLRAKYENVFADRFDRQPGDIPDELWRDRLTWDAAIDQIDRGRFDFLYVHFAMRQLLLGYHASRILGIPLGVTLQAHDIFINPLRHLFPQLLGQCAFVVTVSQYNKEEILRLAPNLAPDSVHVLANGIDVDRFAPRFHDPHKPFRFAGTGRLVEIKGWHVLVEAAGLLKRRRDDFIVQIVGEGPLREQLERRRDELSLGEHFQLMGRRDATYLQDWLPDQDCFVLPCVIAKDGNRDGMPLALREGMACGLPALSTRLLGLHETVSEGTGLLVQADDPPALADAMERFIELSSAKYRAMAESARIKAESEFSLLHEVRMLTLWMEQALDGLEGVTNTDAARPLACAARTQ
jgi:colanic acid/amylovoran biosynthesis glycosyltransferase